MPTTTITFGEVAENGPEMQKLGRLAPRGLSLPELQHAHVKFRSLGFQSELVDLAEASGVADLPQAWLLVVRGGAAAFVAAETKSEDLDDFVSELLRSFPTPSSPSTLSVTATPPSTTTTPPSLTAMLPSLANPADRLAAEQKLLIPDKKAIIRGKLKNKLARWNLTFADVAQEPDYPQGKGRVVPFNSVPVLNRIRTGLPEYFGSIARELYAEGNYYYSSKCGIGRHGDGERRIVIAIRLGDEMKLIYQWYLRFKPIGRRIDFVLKHGDLYAMSEKAVGTDWKRSVIPTLRHAAGHESYLGPA